MKRSDGLREKVDRILQGDPMALGGRTLQPAARLTGWQRSGSGEHWAWTTAKLRLQPVEVVVSGPDGNQERLAIGDATEKAIRSVVGTGLAVAALSLLLIAVRRGLSHSI